MIKKFALAAFSIILLGSVLIFSSGNIKGDTEVEGYGAEASFEDTDITIEDALVYIIESQYLTDEINSQIMESYGKVKPYVAMSETNDGSILKIKSLMETYGLEIPENKSEEHIKTHGSLENNFTNNLESSYENEIKNIVMYESFLNMNLPEDINSVIIELKDNSIDNLKRIENSLSDITGTSSETTVDNNIFTKFYNWLGRSFDNLIYGTSN